MKIKFGEGEVNINKFSRLRKLMRAARRGKIPDERMVIIETAEREAATRREKYTHSMARRWERVRLLVEKRATL